MPKNLKLYFKGHELTVVNNFKYLGCVLTSDLNDSFDIIGAAFLLLKASVFYLGNLSLSILIFF